MTFSDSSVSRSSITTTREHSHRDRLYRHPDHGLLGGVCAGIADRLHINASIVRGIAAASVGFGGIGIALYVLAWALVPIGPSSGQRRRSPAAWLAGFLIVIGAACMAFAAHSFGVPRVPRSDLASRTRGLRDGARMEADRRRGRTDRRVPGDPGRAARGVRLGRAAARGGRASTASARRSGAVAIVATVVGLLVGPWFVRLAQQPRVRALGAHPRAGARRGGGAPARLGAADAGADPEARRRPAARWRGSPADRSASCAAGCWSARGAGERRQRRGALERAAAEVEELHGVPIEVVTVGDAPLDERLEALVQAAREAMTNAAKFAGSERVRSVRRGRRATASRCSCATAASASTWTRAGRPARGARLDRRAHGAPRRPRRGPQRARRGHRGRAGHGASDACSERAAARRDRRRPRICSAPACARSSATSGGRGRAGTVDEAVAMIASTRPDVVLLDVHMPDGGGVEVIARRRRRACPDGALSGAVGVRCRGGRDRGDPCGRARLCDEDDLRRGAGRRGAARGGRRRGVLAAAGGLRAGRVRRRTAGAGRSAPIRTPSSIS